LLWFQGILAGILTGILTGVPASLLYYSRPGAEANLVFWGFVERKSAKKR